MNALDAIARRVTHAVDCADAVGWLTTLPDDSVDLLVTSPPYEKARTYGLDTMVAGQAWVDWMVKVVTAAAPKVKGLIAVNCEGQTTKHRYSATPMLLAADLHRAGFHLRHPIAFHRVGVPGSGGKATDHAAAGGGPDWLRQDWEPIICIARPGKLPWADGTACGRRPKWAPGGEMSNRLTNGSRRGQWGETDKSGGARRADGKRQDRKRPSRKVTKKGTSGHANGEIAIGDYAPPKIANPGNLVRRTYTPDEMAELLDEASDLIHCVVGGNQMGHKAAHRNEAPFPLDLAEFFVRSFCPEGGVVADPFCGSGTTIHAAVEHGRVGIGCDIRASQVEITRKRMLTVTPTLF